VTNVPPGCLVRAVTRIADALAKVRRRLVPRHFSAVELGTMSWVAQSVAAFCELGLPDAFANGARTSGELAAEGYGNERMLFRLLRNLAAYDVVKYVGHDRFSLGHIGRGLTGEHSAAPLVLYANAPWHVKAYAHLASAIRAGRPGFELSEGMPMFEFFGKNERAGALFDGAMQSLTPLFAGALAAAYDFGQFQHIADVGGGTGILLSTILEKYPRVHGTVFELPAVAQRTRELAQVMGLSERLKVVEGDIFVDVPPHADAYILSHVLHDWDDDSCVLILQNLRHAMQPDARLLIYEIVAAPPNNHWSQDRITDLEMMAMLSGRERTRDEFDALLSRSGLRLVRIISTAAAESIVEARPETAPLDASGSFDTSG